MICSSRRSLISLAIIIASLFISHIELSAVSGDEVSTNTIAPLIKSGGMLPFTRMMKEFPQLYSLSSDARIDRFVSKEFSLSETSYAPSDLKLLTGGSIDTAGRIISLREEASLALMLLAKDFEKKFDRPLVVVS